MWSAGIAVASPSSGPEGSALGAALAGSSLGGAADRSFFAADSSSVSPNGLRRRMAFCPSACTCSERWSSSSAVMTTIGVPRPAKRAECIACRPLIHGIEMSVTTRANGPSSAILSMSCAPVSARTTSAPSRSRASATARSSSGSSSATRTRAWGSMENPACIRRAGRTFVGSHAAKASPPCGSPPLAASGGPIARAPRATAGRAPGKGRVAQRAPWRAPAHSARARFLDLTMSERVAPARAGRRETDKVT